MQMPFIKCCISEIWLDNLGKKLLYLWLHYIRRILYYCGKFFGTHIPNYYLAQELLGVIFVKKLFIEMYN